MSEVRLSTVLGALPLAVTRTASFEESMVTSGGVSLKEVDPATLASRLRPSLYFAGEILDLDGPEGGWNLHWAFASGTLAGRSAAASLGEGQRPRCPSSGPPPCPPREVP